MTGSRSKVKVKVIQDGGAHVGGNHGNGGCFPSNGGCFLSNGGCFLSNEGRVLSNGGHGGSVGWQPPYWIYPSNGVFSLATGVFSLATGVESLATGVAGVREMKTRLDKMAVVMWWPPYWIFPSNGCLP